MSELKVSNDTSAFEVPAAFDREGKLIDRCARQALEIIVAHPRHDARDFATELSIKKRIAP